MVRSEKRPIYSILKILQDCRNCKTYKFHDCKRNIIFTLIDLSETCIKTLWGTFQLCCDSQLSNSNSWARTFLNCMTRLRHEEKEKPLVLFKRQKEAIPKSQKCSKLSHVQKKTSNYVKRVWSWSFSDNLDKFTCKSKNIWEVETMISQEKNGWVIKLLELCFLH